MVAAAAAVVAAAQAQAAAVGAVAQLEAAVANQEQREPRTATHGQQKHVVVIRSSSNASYVLQKETLCPSTVAPRRCAGACSTRVAK
jgi:hypothetical protein